MFMKSLVKTAAIAAFFVSAALSSAQALVVGVTDTNPNHSNSAPFGSAQAAYVYQQVFDDSAFSGPLTINQLTFYDTILKGGSPNPGSNFQIYLAATTTQQVNAITDNFPVALINSATLVFNGAIPALANGRLDFTLSQSFAYDPSGGTNLLLIVKNFDLSGSATPLFLDSDTRGTVTSSRQYSGPNGPAGNLKTGLVTGFNDVVAVPEPATWGSMLAGLALIGFMATRRRQRSPAIG